MTAPNANIKVSGAWKTVNKMHVKVSGTWKRVNSAYVRVSGAWKKFLQSVVASSFSGVLAVTGTTSTITGTARTYTLGAGNSGQVQFTGVSMGGSGFQYSINGGSYTGNDITEGKVITLTNGQTLTIRGVGMTSGSTNFCAVYDYDTGTKLEDTFVNRT